MPRPAATSSRPRSTWRWRSPATSRSAACKGEDPMTTNEQWHYFALSARVTGDATRTVGDLTDRLTTAFRDYGIGLLNVEPGAAEDAFLWDVEAALCYATPNPHEVVVVHMFTTLVQALRGGGYGFTDVHLTHDLTEDYRPALVADVDRRTDDA